MLNQDLFGPKSALLISKMVVLNQILNFQIFGNSGKAYLNSLVVFLVLLLVLKIFREKIFRILKEKAQKTQTEIDDILVEIVASIKPPFYFFVALYFGLISLSLPLKLEKIINSLFILVIVFQAIKAFHIFIDRIGTKIISKKGDEKEKIKSEATLKTLTLILKIILWVLAGILILSSWGINVNSLIAGLGIGGIAVALAVQSILGDIFSSFSLVLDKPFEIGDFIVVGAHKGIVKKVGIKTTRIQTLQGEELVISNKELTESRIQNFGKMKERRIQFSFGVCYETPLEKLKKIPEIVKEIIGGIEGAKLDRVHFKEFKDFALIFEVVYYVLSPDYLEYMNIQQEINFKLKEIFEKESIEFAYPTQTIYLFKANQG